jgi:hypothetical protein
MKSEIERRRHRRAMNTLGLLFTTLGPLTISLLFAAYSPPAHADTVIVFGTFPGGEALPGAGPNNDPSNTAIATGGAAPPVLLTVEQAATPSQSAP